MKKLKNLITYGIIGLLCLAAASGFIMNQVKARKNAEPAGMVPSVDVRASEDPQAHLEAVMKKSAAMPTAEPIVGIAQGEDYSEVTRKVIENAGGIQDIIKEGDTVILKPNLIRGAPAGSPVCTDVRVMQELADIAWECGAARVIVAESSPAGNVYHQAEYDTLKNVELVDMNECRKEDCYELKAEDSQTGKSLLIPKIYMDADVVIGAAKLKTHQMKEAQVTLGLKLSMGVPPSSFYFGSGYKIGLHNMGLKKVIVDLNRIRRPDLVVIDGIVAGEGLGPVQVVPVQANIMFAGRDLVALDTVAAAYMGYAVKEVPHLQLASDKGLGISDLSKIQIIGGDLDAIKTRFRRPFE